MSNLDSIDFKILYELFLNSRQSTLSISKKTNINQSVIKYRIKKLEKSGVIQGYSIILNYRKIDYRLYRLYISLQFTSTVKEKEIIYFFQEKKNTWRIESSTGKYDIILTLLIKKPRELFYFYKEIMDRFSDHFKKITIYESYETFGFRANTNMKKKSKNLDKNFQAYESYELDEPNKKILYFLNKNAKVPIIDLSKNLALSGPTVVSRIKKLIDDGVIENFSILINSEKVGFKRFLLRLSIVHYKKIDSIIQYFSLISYVEEINKVIGEYHLEIILHTNTLEHFHAIIDDFRTKYSDEINDYDYFIISKVYANPCNSRIFK